MATFYVSMPNVAPIFSDAGTNVSVVNTNTSVAGANGSLVILTPTTILAPGTYWVGGNFTATTTTTFTNTDAIYFRIIDTAAAITYYPQTLMTGYSQVGVGPSAIVCAVSGLIVLTTATTLTWGASVSLASTAGTTLAMNNGFYKRVA